MDCKRIIFYYIVFLRLPRENSNKELKTKKNQMREKKLSICRLAFQLPNYTLSHKNERTLSILKHIVGSYRQKKAHEILTK